MIDAIKGLLGSKKALAAVAGVIVTLVGKIGIQLDTDALVVLISPIVAFCIGQGIADNGKEAAKVSSGTTPPAS